MPASTKVATCHVRPLPPPPPQVASCQEQPAAVCGQRGGKHAPQVGAPWAPAVSSMSMADTWVTPFCAWTASFWTPFWVSSTARLRPCCTCRRQITSDPTDRQIDRQSAARRQAVERGGVSVRAHRRAGSLHAACVVHKWAYIPICRLAGGERPIMTSHEGARRASSLAQRVECRTHSWGRQGGILQAPRVPWPSRQRARRAHHRNGARASIRAHTHTRTHRRTQPWYGTA